MSTCGQKTAFPKLFFCAQALQTLFVRWKFYYMVETFIKASEPHHTRVPSPYYISLDLSKLNQVRVAVTRVLIKTLLAHSHHHQA